MCKKIVLLFEIPSSILPGKMASQLALTELPSLNLAPFILLNPVRTAISEGRRNTCIEEREEAPFPRSPSPSLHKVTRIRAKWLQAGRQAGTQEGTRHVGGRANDSCLKLWTRFSAHNAKGRNTRNMFGRQMLHAQQVGRTPSKVGNC